MAHSHVLGRTQDMTCLHRIPSQPIPEERSISSKKSAAHRPPLSTLPNKPNIRLTHSPPLRLTRMLRPIKNQHFPRNSLRRNQVRILGHIPRPINLPCMVDLLYNLDARGRGDRMSPQFPTLVIVICTIELVCPRPACARIAFGDVDGGDLEVVLCLAGCVCPEEETVGCVGFGGVSGGGVS